MGLNRNRFGFIEDVTLVPCPRCAKCERCKGSSREYCHHCPVTHILKCALCKVCDVCSGSQLVSAEKRAEWLQRVL